MLKLLRDLTVHKGHANRIILEAIREHEAARQDPEILALLHHILVANRFWFLMWVGQPFVAEKELQPPDSLEALIRDYAALQSMEESWLAGLAEDDLQRVIETPHIPGGRCSVAEGVMQVCLHSHGHRAQISKMFRARGGTPPMTDFILWLARRPVPDAAGQPDVAGQP
jgi:uncharacterized damage-inducible protein DinB